MIVRMFDTAVDPEDVERGVQLFRTQVKPAFEAFDGCSGIEMFIGVAPEGGFADVVAISHWETEEHIDRAISSEEYAEALAELKSLFQRAPIVRHFEAAD